MGFTLSKRLINFQNFQSLECKFVRLNFSINVKKMNKERRKYEVIGRLFESITT